MFLLQKVESNISVKMKIHQSSQYVEIYFFRGPKVPKQFTFNFPISEISPIEKMYSSCEIVNADDSCCNSVQC